MADRRTIEDVLDADRHYIEPYVARQQTANLHAATADGPVPSADGSVIAHRTDPELAEFLRSVAADLRRRARMYHAVDPSADKFERAALLAAPAPADPEGDGQ